MKSGGEKAGFRILDHPADLGIEAWGPDLAAAVQESVKGLMSIIVDPGSVQAVGERIVELEAADEEQLLVRLLSDILFLVDGEQFLPSRLEIREISPGLLAGVLQGENLDPPRHHLKVHVKAVTYHQLAIEKGSNLVRITVFVDI